MDEGLGFGMNPTHTSRLQGFVTSCLLFSIPLLVREGICRVLLQPRVTESIVLYWWRVDAEEATFI